jgi:DNA-binding GntR family transcriptional regulator
MNEKDLPYLTFPKISDEVYEALKTRILSKHFVPGERLNLPQLEQQMGISRTPLKDALNRLTVEGLLRIEPRKGTFVSDPTPLEISESFEVRRIIEIHAIRMAAECITEDDLERIRDYIKELRRMVDLEDWNEIYQDYVRLDHELHKQIVAVACNRRLRNIWEQVNTHVHMARIRYGTAEGELDIAQKEHEEILQALEARDLSAVEQAMSNHIDRAKRSILYDLVEHDQ